MVVPPNPRLDLARVTMSGWIRPVEYDIADEGDRGIIMNKENSYEMGLRDETGALQGAFSPCWRWFGDVRVPNHEWTHVAMAYDGTSELHYVHGVHQETDPCGDPGGSLTPTPDPLRLGARGQVSFCQEATHCSQFQVRRSMHQDCLLNPRNFVSYPFFTPFFAHFLRLDARNPENTARIPGENGEKSRKIGGKVIKSLGALGRATSTR
eukprot:COSAG04_NODE_80_length_28110_cov_13.522847_22_plen_209_part_00